MAIRRRPGVGLAALATLAAGCGSGVSSANNRKAGSTGTGQASGTGQGQPASQAANGSPGPEGIPLENGPPLAPAATTAPGTPVNGIQCAPVEQLAYHIHAHLQVFVEGKPRSLPGAIGMVGPIEQETSAGPFFGASGCYYWLHTHTYDGVIHVESPTNRIYTLGEFFDEWGQPLAPDQVAGAKGKVTAFINGRHWTQNPGGLPLLPHAVIQLDVGSPVVAFSTISWAGTEL